MKVFFEILTIGLLATHLVQLARGFNLTDTDEDDDGEEMNVLIGYKAGQGGPFALPKSKRQLDSGLSHVGALRASLNRTMIRELQMHSDVLYIEEDHKVQMLREIHTPPLKLVHGLTNLIPHPPSSATGACSDPNSFKIGLVDSGIDASHPDLPCQNVGSSDSNCIGSEFGMPSSEHWYAPTISHGTMVAGIIGAIRGNNQGISGMLDNTKVCFVVARVFSDNSGGTTMLSDILEGVYWAYQQGAKVINLSLGGPSTATTARNLYQAIRDSGVLLIAAAGNDGSSVKSYPASYDSCISVAAVDDSMNRASFSQYNAGVDIAAPGVHILSTAPMGQSALAILTMSDSHVELGQYLVGSPLPSSSVTGPLVYCPNLGKSTCPGNGGHICLIERGDNYFEEKALNCENGGGIAAVIYNNVDVDLEGAALASPTSVTIPVVSVSLQSGQDLLNNYAGTSLTLTSQDGYEYGDGTSFSAPFVTGGAAAIWQACPKCTANEVEQCLLSSALDLGPSGTDIYYGHGLLQVDKAYSCLANTQQCCSSNAGLQYPTASESTASPTPAPVSNPTSSNSDCSTAGDAYHSCFDNNLSFWEEEICRYCINAAVPYDMTTTSCSSIDAALCPAIFDTCKIYCGRCAKSIERYLACSVHAVRSDCNMNCNVATNGFNNGDSAPFTTPPTSGTGVGSPIGLVGGNSPSASPSRLRSVSAAPNKVLFTALVWTAGAVALMI